jgi:transposase-like protein
MVENVIDIDGERKWTQVIDEARQFSDGVTAYCKRENISKRVYYDWFAKLRPQHPEWQDLMKGIKSTGAPQDENGSTTEVRAKLTRRNFSPAKKKKILQEIEDAPPGGVAAILRREGVYSTQVQKWRAERDGLSLTERKRGPKPEPLLAELRKLRAQNERLEKKLYRSQKIIELQKKVSEILGVTLEALPDDD